MRKTYKVNLKNETPSPVSRGVISSPPSAELKSTEAEDGIHPRPKNVPRPSAKEDKRILKIPFWITIFLALTLVLYWTARVSYQRIGVFGCFDQCFNFVAGYFMLKGKLLYSQIFFNHQPLMAFLSYWIQKITQPVSLYHLVLYHRLFVLFFSLAMDFLLILRFREKGIAFVLFYETTKFYLLGNFFLPESLIAYFLAFNCGLLLESFLKKNLSIFDYLLAAFFTWAIIFLGVPSLPPALLLYGLILFYTRSVSYRKRLPSIGLFLILTSLILVNLPIKDYLFDLFRANYQFVSNETRATGTVGLGILKVFFYPFLIFFIGKSNLFRLALIGLSGIFCLQVYWQIFKLKKLGWVVVIFILLGLSALRYVEPGTVFYEAFHQLSWYSIFLVIVIGWLFEMLNHQHFKKISIFLMLSLFSLWLYVSFSTKSFLWEKVNLEQEFTVNYAPYFAYGNIVKILAQPGDTLFLDQWDDLIYWQSGLDSAYQYSLYTPAMTKFNRFTKARLEMFETNPPDFYYSYYGASENCAPLFPEKMKNEYLQLFFANNPTCLYLKKTKLAEISDLQWQEVKKLGFGLSNTTK